MKKVKIIFFFMIILCCMLFSGCGAHIDSKISLNTDGSGKREITCTIPYYNLNKMIGGESALDNLLKKNKPSILTMQKKKVTLQPFIHLPMHSKALMITFHNRKALWGVNRIQALIYPVKPFIKSIHFRKKT